jgi:ADP-heptose:LPS heptosyltransferase
MEQLIRAIIRQIREKILYRIPLSHPDPQTVLMIRMDGIGDYILFRNFLPSLRKAEILRGGKKLVLLANDHLKPIIETLDADQFDAFIWMDTQAFIRASYFQKWRYIYRIRRRYRPQTVLIATHSRPMMDDMIVQTLGAPLKIASAGDDMFMGAVQKERSDNRYHHLVPTLPTQHFEFYRNKVFFENLIGQTIPITKPKIDLPDEKKEKRNSISLFIGGSMAYRRWSAERFGELIGLCHAAFPDVSFVLLGGLADAEIGETVRRQIPETAIVQNLCGCLSIAELIAHITSSKLLISNDSAGHHMAAAVETACICISNGNHFGRFHPYPTEMNCPHWTVYPSDDFYEAENFETLAQAYRDPLHSATLNDINTISAERVFERVHIFLRDET